MNIKYINKDPHTVNDAEIYTFKYNEIKDIPDHLANYLISKFPHSFVKAENIVKKTIIQFADNVKSVAQELSEPNIIDVYFKGPDDNKFSMLPDSPQGVKLI